MTELTSITLENEMDLTLAYKKSIRTAELLGLTISTQTAFATAVSEVCREVIDKAFDGVLTLGVLAEDGRFFLVAKAACRIDEFFSRSSDGLEYARKLVPMLEVEIAVETLTINAKLGIPRSARIDQRRVSQVKQQLKAEGPISAYEEVKMRNAELSEINQQQKYLDNKKNEFLSLASHELNSPLTILRSFSQMAIRINNDPQLDHYLKKIEQQTSKLANLTKQLMDISRIEDGQVTYQQEAVNLKAYLGELAQSLQFLVPAHSLSIDAGSDADVLIDPLRIEQVMINLVGNAAKYSEAGKAILVQASRENGAVHIAVKDEGIGMDQATSQKVFEKFYRSELAVQKYTGLGMGLYVASRIVKDHGGDMRVESSPGEGSVFTFTLPVQ